MMPEHTEAFVHSWLLKLEEVSNTVDEKAKALVKVRFEIEELEHTLESDLRCQEIKCSNLHKMYIKRALGAVLTKSPECRTYEKITREELEEDKDLQLVQRRQVSLGPKGRVLQVPKGLLSQQITFQKNARVEEGFDSGESRDATGC
ncbi:hypothetical protein WJX75_003956 [Coccomyxa subellipsoidea]|uniref:Rx N-terminal domain-containing protein n=1 Tax=Coccomyxa subellipsoidea TaxID=248742 RepID=A0ABR2YRH0_9CHLO